jgi:fructosamine-3-kinase
MHEHLRSSIAEILGEEIRHVTPLSGGDISNAYRVETPGRILLLKVHEGHKALAMFTAESGGLEAIVATGTIRAPRVEYCGVIGDTAILLMEYVETKRPGPADDERLGRQLAQMHQVTHKQFGWATDNFIGSLPQKNTWYDDWIEFYMANRLRRQIAMAMDRNLLSARDVPSEEQLVARLEDLFHDVRPSLVHGDLWGGNFLISSEGEPYLIDPAIYYGHSEVDLAMSRLFGGFGDRFYSAYQDLIPRAPGHMARNEIYQLYYLLVHLNLFGATYLGPVRQILYRLR